MSLSDYFYSPILEDQEQTKLSKAQAEEAFKQTKFSKGTYRLTVRIAIMTFLILLLTIVLVLREFAIL